MQRKIIGHRDVSPHPTLRLSPWQRAQLAAFHLAGGVALNRFKRRLVTAETVNAATLTQVLTQNADTVMGRQYGFANLSRSHDVVAAYRQRVPLSTYADYHPLIERIARGEERVLSADPVTLLAGTSGTTAQPKRIPRTRRAQAHHLMLVVLAQQAVVDRGIAGARSTERGINLMSLSAPVSREPAAVPLMSGANAGLARMRKLISLLWSSPEAVFHIRHQPSALYLHALFGLLNRAALYIETPFAPQVVAWLALMERHHPRLAADLARGTVSDHLELSAPERQRLQALLWADPQRAREVTAAFAQGLGGILQRLWPTMRYIRTVTSGSFGLSLPRLRWLAGPALAIQSGCHSSSEGVIGLNLKTDGSNEYVLAVGTSFFEFIPFSCVDDPRPPTVGLAALESGEDYEVVMTSCAGLYRYRLGDVIRITGRWGTAPVFQFRCRRGTILNLVGEKTTEWHTTSALQSTVSRWLNAADAIVDYTVAGSLATGVGQYTFYVELRHDAGRARASVHDATAWLDQELGSVNQLYRHLGRHPERLAPPRLCLVNPGTFDAVARLQLARSGGVSATQIKTPRLVSGADQLALLEDSLAGAGVI